MAFVGADLRVRPFDDHRTIETHPHPALWATFPLAGGRLGDGETESFRHGCAAVGSSAALRMRRTPCGCCAVPPPFDKGGCPLSHG